MAVSEFTDTCNDSVFNRNTATCPNIDNDVVDQLVEENSTVVNHNDNYQIDGNSNGTCSNIAIPSDDPSLFDDYIAIKTQLLKVTSEQESLQHNYDLIGLEYNANKFDLVTVTTEQDSLQHNYDLKVNEANHYKRRCSQFDNELKNINMVSLLHNDYKLEDYLCFLENSIQKLATTKNRSPSRMACSIIE
jgi:hypothetical protein